MAGLAAVEIRDATSADWAGIWPFLRAIVRAGETYTLPRDLDEPSARAFWMRAAALVAVDGDTVLGTAKVVPNQHGPGAHVANASFMVDPAHGGKGVGRALGAAVLDRARADGYRAMQFNAVGSSAGDEGMTSHGPHATQSGKPAAPASHG